MELAPVILFVYKRLYHTKRTVEALKSNKYATQTNLFIFSDAPKNQFDNKEVIQVRNYIRTISNFKKVEIIEREKNFGLAESIISGVSEIITQYNRAIILEDDLITSSNFLCFMNSASEFYESYKNVFSISGYTLPIKIPDLISSDIFFSYRSSSWGWTTWKDRWVKADWNVNNFNNLKNNKELQKKFNRGGEDLTSMLFAQQYGYNDSWAIRWAYTHFINNAVCVYPVKSKVINIGTDRSGTHFTRTTKRYSVSLYEGSCDFEFQKEIILNENINDNIQKFFVLSPLRKTINFIRFNFLK